MTTPHLAEIPPDREDLLAVFGNPPPGTLVDLTPFRRELGRRDPVWWMTDTLGCQLWSKQVEIIESVRDHRRTAVHTAHGLGKSYVAARIAAWWIGCHEPGSARVVTSAPTGDLVKAVLWHEIGRAHAEGSLLGRVNQTEWWVPIADSPKGDGSVREEMVAFGRKPAEHNYSALQGIHEKYILVIFDESCGIPEKLWAAGDSLTSGAHCRFLAIGNPDDPNTEFAKVCKPGSGWNVIGISAFDSPNLTDGEGLPQGVLDKLVSKVWCDERKEKWGETNPYYISKVLGRFPDTTTDGLIPMSWVRAAQQANLEPSEPVELGVDVGGGGDRNVIAHRQGPVVRVVLRDQNPDTMATLGNTINLVKKTGARVAKVDKIGIGRGAVDRAREVARSREYTDAKRAVARRVKGINVGSKARDPEGYINLRAEGYWALRERFRATAAVVNDGAEDKGGLIDIDPADEDLAAQLVDLRYHRSSTGRIQIESKESMAKRGKPSPDEADAVMLAFLPTGKGRGGKSRGTWGKRRRERMRTKAKGGDSSGGGGEATVRGRRGYVGGRSVYRGRSRA